METKDSTTTATTGKIIQIDEGRVRDHLAEIVRGSVEETVNTMRQKEAGGPVRGHAPDEGGRGRDGASLGRSGLRAHAAAHDASPWGRVSA